MKHSSLTKLAAAFACLLLLSACATTSPDTTAEDSSDPWEPLNRKVNSFNTVVDRYTLKPAARAYQHVMPAKARTGIRNFFDNLQTPASVINNLLQGKPKAALTESGRFLANSTWGVLGFVDVGSDLGLEEKTEDFDQTLAVWGVPQGPYVVLPFLGPKTLRGTFAYPVDMATDPVTYIDHDRTRYATRALSLISIRSDLLAADKMLEDSFDPYLTLRESYLQNRNYQIHDGNPPQDDDFYDDFEDFDDFEDYEDGNELDNETASR